MEDVIQISKEQKYVKIFSWILIVGSTLVLLKALLLMNGYSGMIKLQGLTKDFKPPIQINFALYFILNSIELLLSIIIFISATYVLKYRNLWRKVLIYSLIASILFLFISPIFDYIYFTMRGVIAPKGMDDVLLSTAKSSILIISYFWALLFSVFFIVVIRALSKKEILVLFK